MAFILTMLVIAAAGYGFYRLVQPEKPKVAPPVAPEPPPQPKPLW